MSDDRWAKLHRLYDPEDLVRDRELTEDRRPGRSGAAKRKLTEEDFYRRIDDSDRDRDGENR